MAVTWRLLPTVKFWSSKRQKEIPCNQLLCDFGRLLEDKDEEFVQGFHFKDLLFTTVALFGKNLSEMTSDSLFPVITRKAVKTLILLEEYSHDGAINSSLYNAKTENKLDKDLHSETIEDSNLGDVKKEDEVAAGEFDDIFSDSSESDNESLGESDDVVDFSEEFKHFTAEIKRRRYQNNEKGKDLSIEKLIVGAVTYDRSYRVPNESTLHIHLLAVRKKFRNCGVGTWLIEQLKNPDLVGPYDAIVTYADPDAVTFFANKDFTDDVVLNSKYRKIDDNWLNSTPMCFIPHFASNSSLLRSTGSKNMVTSADIKDLENKVKEWKSQQTTCYQSQMICILAAINQLKILQKTVESRNKVIEKLKKENLQLRTRLRDNGYFSDEKSEESRVSYEFVEQLLIEKNIFNVEVTRVVKASVSRDQFYSRLESLKDPLMFTELYYCGGSSAGGLEALMLNGFSDEDFTCGCYGRGLYFSQSPRKAMEFSTPGGLLLCLVGLGNTYSQVKIDPPRTKPPEGCDSILTIGRQSLGNQHVTGQEYVIFDSNQAVPVYLLDFEVEWGTADF